MVKRSFFPFLLYYLVFIKVYPEKNYIQKTIGMQYSITINKKYNSNSLETDYIIYYNNLVETFL
ncbi:hypothetical protein LMQOC1_31282 [Listeria monocytogenes QOC1]|nr:hypothetical protein LMQOC1_31282 [Listeria monocytogenes QOC1]